MSLLVLFIHYQNQKSDLEFFELLEDHVIWHVVKEAIGRCEDDVTELHVEGGAVGCFRTGRNRRHGKISHKWRLNCCQQFASVELSRSLCQNLKGEHGVGV